jgi:hypothetical protein
MTENRFASSDCFYTFSNAEYDAMQEKSELQRANLYPFQGYSNNAKQMPTSEELCSVLNEMNSDTSIEGSVDVITRAINNVSANITEESGLDSDKYSVEFDFISKAVEMIVASFVEAMLTPKMLLVFLVNKKLMGEASGKWDVEYLLDAFFNIIVAMVNEAIDMLVKKLLDFVMEKIKELLEAAAKLLLWEYVEFYARLLSQMIKACSFRLPNNPNLASTLDNVNYADIEPLSEDSMPISEC